MSGQQQGDADSVNTVFTEEAEEGWTDDDDQPGLEAASDTEINLTNELLAAGETGNFDDFMRIITNNPVDTYQMSWALASCTSVDIMKKIVLDRGVWDTIGECYINAFRDENWNLLDAIEALDQPEGLGEPGDLAKCVLDHRLMYAIGILTEAKDISVLERLFKFNHDKLKGFKPTDADMAAIQTFTKAASDLLELIDRHFPDHHRRHQELLLADNLTGVSDSSQEVENAP